MSIKHLIISMGVFVFSLLLMFALIRGKGNPPYFQTPGSRDTQLMGPFESSGSTSRYVLTRSIVEKGNVSLDIEDARFGSPDVSGTNGKYFTVFMPGVSFAGVPFYWMGKQIGYPQLAAYFSTTIFSILNIFLVAKISRKLGSGNVTSYIAGITFLFATNALTYALSYTQHHLSTVLILAMVLNAFSKRNWINNIILGLLAGFSFWVDVPNLFIILPIGLYVFFKNFDLEQQKKSNRLRINIAIIGLVFGLLPTLIGLSFYNKQTTGSYTSIPQMSGRTRFDPITGKELPKEIIKDDGNNLQAKSKSEGRYIPFNSRLQVNGLYVLLVSNERGLLYFAPTTVFGILGWAVLYRSKKYRNYSMLLMSIALMNLVIYSMFGDVYGGWAFGARYMIPAFAILSSMVAVALTTFRKNYIVILLFIISTIYSVYINTLGAGTTTQVPPKVEAANLITPIPYTYKYNFDLIQNNQSSSLLYNSYLYRYYSAHEFVLIYTSLVVALIIGLTLLSYREEGIKDEKI